ARAGLADAAGGLSSVLWPRPRAAAHAGRRRPLRRRRRCARRSALAPALVRGDAAARGRRRGAAGGARARRAGGAERGRGAGDEEAARRSVSLALQALGRMKHPAGSKKDRERAVAEVQQSTGVEDSYRALGRTFLFFTGGRSGLAFGAELPQLVARLAVED